MRKSLLVVVTFKIIWSFPEINFIGDLTMKKKGLVVFV